MSYTGSTPDTTSRDTDWRSTAACREEDPELFFPKGSDGPWALVIEEAKKVCRSCPVADACLKFALDEGIPSGIFGGLTDDERRSVQRAARRHKDTPATAEKRTAEARQPRRPRTLQSIFDDNTTALYGGHLAWTGATQVYVGSRRYSPRQIAFIVGRGCEPNGPVTSDCGRECVLPAHLADMTERSGCGTRNGYARHRRNGEDACDACRQANTDADNRLRRTGTTKALAA